MSIRKTLALFLALLMLASLASCMGSRKEQTETTPGIEITESTTSMPGETENPYKPDAAKVRYDGYTLNIANDMLSATDYFTPTK